MFSLLSSIVRHRRLLGDFVARDLKARYVGSSMGFFWSVVFPIINLFVYMFVFRMVLNARWSDSQGALEVSIIMLGGIVVWTAFAETISRATNCLVDNANLIQKVVFPAEVLPAYLTLSSLINMCIGLPVVIAAVFWFGHVSRPQAYLRIPYEDVLDAEGEPARVEKAPIKYGEWSPRTTEDDERAHEYVVKVQLTRGWRKPLTIPFRIEGTAQRGVDYDMPADEIEIPAGKLVGQLVFVPHADQDEQEGDESLSIELDPAGEAPVMLRGDPVVEGGPRLDMWLTDKPAQPDPGDPAQAFGMRREGVAGAFLPQAPARKAHEVREDYHPLGLGVSLLALPLLFLFQVAFTAGLGYFLAAFNLYLRDTYHVVGVAVTVWMFATPIFYPAHLVQKAHFGWILWLNPMHWLIDSYRRVFVFGIWPQPIHLALLAGVSLLMLMVGSRFFMSQRAKFPDLL